ncbi:metallophosphoesterase [Pseudoflavonifractor phocaeensis]|nr:metallophosphoesterase family protein [Pseudoflavonifractor phocaeensis]MCQ4863490.1 metallophosphoesterase [Pseudoflavonifractor phocaeensis]
MIYATGDTHGNFLRFGTDFFSEQKGMTRNDYVIICGDFGGVWDDSKESQYWLDWLNAKPFTTLFVCGNHENYDMLNQSPAEEWHGGKVHKIRSHIYHLMRGQVFDIDGYSFFTMGGARSHDIRDGILEPGDPAFRQKKRRLDRQGGLYRINHRTWWAEEMPSAEEYEAARAALERVGWEVDYIVTHCAPTSIAQTLGESHEPDTLTDFLEEVRGKTQFHYWLFGHYHQNTVLRERYVLLWEQMVRIT